MLRVYTTEEIKYISHQEHLSFGTPRAPIFIKYSDGKTFLKAVEDIGIPLEYLGEFVDISLDILSKKKQSS